MVQSDRAIYHIAWHCTDLSSCKINQCLPACTLVYDRDCRVSVVSMVLPDFLAGTEMKDLLEMQAPGVHQGLGYAAAVSLAYTFILIG